MPTESESSQPGGTDQETLAHHLGHLAADADDVMAMLTAHHAEGGDLHQDALAKTERLQSSLHDVIHALTRHEHLAMGSDDVWAMLSRKHDPKSDDPIK
ncbi:MULTISPECIES: hypothetical protein [Candidatus Neomicrothrix]|jgi:hypothetical protein|uniref:Uncharacterized protein n=1 Tax=Candidatus Neomicrothrix parvicella RN1 TaxID=1229780 RepID=R4Z3Y6_9ACTN|nr:MULTISPECIES: hypothetical protein [Microthrix]NLH64736.1 hypothetical protein [Candidatus Microthrix parvicella]MBK6503326.1 hypothetical protein [Candidatus Microthrix sp.]MBK7018094.1 hypothetical protein [Candidatus Microthrix sp.]MBK7323421.1 hypothetical protein [Candidatus Microthrix sp.]MBL0204803.1 hypothetical protein [Candidatus Microthrix sp.]